MTETGLTKRRRRPTRYGMKRMTIIACLAGSGVAGGCVNITAPNKPIEINLNINVTQQVVYRLDGEAKSLIQANPGIF
jgi:YnbE-like lipoprotein